MNSTFYTLNEVFITEDQNSSLLLEFRKVDKNLFENNNNTFLYLLEILIDELTIKLNNKSIFKKTNLISNGHKDYLIKLKKSKYITRQDINNTMVYFCKFSNLFQYSKQINKNQ